MRNVLTLFFLCVYSVAAYSYDGLGYKLYLKIRGNTIRFHVVNSTSKVLFIPIDIHHIDFQDDSVILECIDYNTDVHYNSFIPPPMYKILACKRGKYKTYGAAFSTDMRYFLRVFDKTFEEFIKQKNIKDPPYINTFKAYQTECSFLVEGILE